MPESESNYIPNEQKSIKEEKKIENKQPIIIAPKKTLYIKWLIQRERALFCYKGPTFAIA